MPDIIKKNAPLIQSILWICGSIITVVVGALTFGFDARYVKADEIEQTLAPVFSTVGDVETLEDEVDGHMAEWATHSRDEVGRPEFDTYIQTTNGKFDAIERLVLRVDDKLDRLIEMGHPE